MMHEFLKYFSGHFDNCFIMLEYIYHLTNFIFHKFFHYKSQAPLNIHVWNLKILPVFSNFNLKKLFSFQKTLWNLLMKFMIRSRFLWRQFLKLSFLFIYLFFCKSFAWWLSNIGAICYLPAFIYLLISLFLQL